MNLPDDIEFIFVDDGSNPSLGGYNLKNLKRNSIGIEIKQDYYKLAIENINKVKSEEYE